MATSDQANSSTYIGEGKAKSIALAHANLTDSALSYITVKLDYDDGRMVYEVDFYSNGIEYEYEVDALNEVIVEFDQDMKSISSKRQLQIRLLSQMA